MLIRLDKYLADMQAGSRSQVKDAIRKGKVLVDGKTIKKPETKIDVSCQEIVFDGQKICYVSYEYYMLNKPQGVVSATVDSKYPTVVDFIKEKSRKDLFPVGRLDIDTEGLLLITNDGELSHNLLSPKKHVKKCYFVAISGELLPEDQNVFQTGIDIGTSRKEEWTKPATVQAVPIEEIARYTTSYTLQPGESGVLIWITEGKYHQIKRMFAKIGKPVVYLKRLTMGSLKLDERLKPGAYRALTESELRGLKGGAS